MKVGYIGGFWATNIGNAFYNLGALELLRNVFGKKNVFFIPDPPQEYWINLKNDFSLIENLDLDLYIITGPSFNKLLPSVYKKTFDVLKSKNKKLAFLSVGASEYSQSETEIVKNFLNNYSIEFIVTRDKETFDLYKGFKDIPIYNGICTSMFLNDVVNINVPEVLPNKEYVVLNFSYFTEPKIKMKNNNFVVKGRSFPFFQSFIGDYQIVRTVNEPFSHYSYKNYSRPNCYYSDLPYGYLPILKSAKYVISDRVHTCAASLILGSSAMFVKNSKRSNDGRKNLFKKLNLNEIYSKPSKLDFNYIDSEKSKMCQFLQNFSSDN